jgi:hypothetical protein
MGPLEAIFAVCFYPFFFIFEWPVQRVNQLGLSRFH